MKDIKIHWTKCHHGNELRAGMCLECEKEKSAFILQAYKERQSSPQMIPIKRGCKATGGCFCNGSCQEVIGYREPLFPGEKIR